MKVLMYGKIYVDANLLHRGIYETQIPGLYESSTTIESIIEDEEKLNRKFGTSIFSASYVDNLRKCKLVECEIVLKEKIKKNEI